MSISTSELLNLRVDLSDALSWRAAQTPRFIRIFQNNKNSTPGAASVRCATNTEHMWLEGVETPKTKSFSAMSYDETTQIATFTVTDVALWQVGDLFHILGDPAALQIVSLSGTTLNAKIIANNGSNTSLDEYETSAGGVLVFDSRPIQEGSAQGEDLFRQSTVESNFTQIFRGDVELTGTAQAVRQAGFENDVAVQLQYATDAIIRRMNAALLFGVKTRRSATAPGAMGGLYYYGTQSDGLARPQVGAPALSMNMINLAAQDITDAGCVPDTILCGAGQAQVVSTFMASQVNIPQGASTVGTHVEQFVTSAGGAVMRVVVEPSLPDTDVWALDSRGLSLLPLIGRALHTEPASTPGVDGKRAILIGEYTAEFKNAKQAFCRISGLKPSALVLA